MKVYFVNRNPQANGDHEVHVQECPDMPHFNDRKYLGDFASCEDAVEKAKSLYPQANGCKTCIDSCHVS